MIARLRATAARLLHRPIVGAAFGSGRYAMATLPTIRRGLHGVQYMVVDPAAGLVVSIAENPGAALAAARSVLVTCGEAANDSLYIQQIPLFDALPIPDEPDRPRLVSRRRREIHARTAGLCFYCDAPLAVEGPWHVEHQLPRALGGDDQPLNLVAACTSCNLEKRDRSALEFVVDGS